jgi:hypothetical protein
MVISCTGGNPALINVGTFSWYNGSTYITGLATNSPGGVVHKDAFAFASGSFAAATDGAAGGTGSDVGLPTPTDIFIGSQGGTIRWLNGHIRRVDFYNTRLPDAALQSLTA